MAEGTNNSAPAIVGQTRSRQGLSLRRTLLHYIMMPTPEMFHEACFKRPLSHGVAPNFAIRFINPSNPT
jgi:hypothetical protein